METETTVAEWYEKYHQLLQDLIGNYGTVHTPEGLAKNLGIVEARMRALGFSTYRITREGAGDILIAEKAPIDCDTWLGVYGHYDVEPIEKGWVTDPISLVTKNGRLYGRGTGDNLGPLALRLVALEERDPTAACPGIYWILQGEEEIASPFAHETFPKLELPNAALWLEETGYFNEEGDQRFLVQNADSHLQRLLPRLEQVSREFGRNHSRADRFLNKAFGQHQCPYLNHIVKNHPYLGIGPNDDFTGVHQPNESIPLSTLELSLVQFNLVLDEAASWN